VESLDSCSVEKKVLNNYGPSYVRLCYVFSIKNNAKSIIKTIDFIFNLSDYKDFTC
jgi:hypothetical protein